MSAEYLAEQAKVAEALEELGGKHKPVAAYAIAAKVGKSIAATTSLLESLAIRKFTAVEASGWRYVG